MNRAQHFLRSDAAGGGYAPPVLHPARPMDYFQLQDRFWQLEAEQPFSAAEHKFYGYWLNRFNKGNGPQDRWPRTLRRFTKQVAADLTMDEKTIYKATTALQSRGLLRYTAGTRSQSAIWELCTSETLFTADDRKNSSRQPGDDSRDDRNFSTPNGNDRPRTSHDDRKNSGPYKEENKTSSVGENRDEEVAASSPAEPEENNTPHPENQHPLPLTPGGRRGGPHDEPAQMTGADQTPMLTTPALFKAVCLDISLDYRTINFEHYRQEILFDSRDEQLVLMPYQWRKRIRRWLENAKKSKSGLLQASSTPSTPTAGVGSLAQRQQQQAEKNYL